MKTEQPVDRHRESITTIVSRINVLKGSFEEAKFAPDKTVRIPKPSITRFNRKPHDWVRCKGQFKAMVGSQSVPLITKFSHRKELVDPSIRTAIDQGWI